MNEGTGTSESILVVDDTASNRLLYSTLLIRAGYAVRCASNGAEALDLIRQSRPSLVLLDFMMPGMDGGEVVKHLRSEASTRTLPVVILTASVASDDIERALEFGADDYINKPVDSRILIARIKSIIRAHGDREKAQAQPERDALRQELDEAQAVQRAQLPQVPIVWPNWYVIGAVVPSGQVAGDVFDVTSCEDGRGIATLIDVSGHGTASALVAAETRTGFRELVLGRPLIDAVMRLNQRMSERDTGKYACVGAVEVKGRHATIVNAGLPPIVVLRKGVQVESVVATGFPVGMFPDSQYQSVSFETQAGDLIVMVSDGLTEPFGRTDDLSVALSRMQLVEEPPSSELNPEGISRRVRNVARQAAPELQDDATLVVLEAT